MALQQKIEGSGSQPARELSLKVSAFVERVELIKEKAGSGSLTQGELDQFISDVAKARGKRYEKVEFDRYEEREIYPRVLGAGGNVIVAGGQLLLPGSVSSTQPLPEDYSSSADAPITPDIQALADSLDNDPARIYRWVRENIRYEPYFGAMQGAEQTLISRSGNDIDTASLLIVLFRASGYPARYVYGEATATRNETYDLLGVNDVSGALRLLWGTGIPSEFDGVGFKMERVWVEVYAPFYPFLDRKHWIQLDASWKPAKNYTKIDEYISVNSTVNSTVLYDGATANATINETEGYIYGINTTFIEEYLNSTVNVTTLKNITEEFFTPDETSIGETYFPLSMPFSFNKSYEYSLLPDALKYKVTLSLYGTSNASNTLFLTYENNLTGIAGKPFVLDFTPTTLEDAEKLANGTPAYEINMTPQLYLNDSYVNGTNVTYGSDLHVILALWLINSTKTVKQIYAGEKTAIVIDAPKTTYMEYNMTFEHVKALQNSSNDNQTLARDSLFLIGQNFFLSSDLYTDGLADEFGLKWGRPLPAIAFVVKENEVESFDGVPINVTNSGTSIDLKFDQIVWSAGINETIGFNLERGFAVSGFEGKTLEVFYNVTGISTSSLLDKAVGDNVPIYFISNATVDRLDNLPIPESDRELIRSLLNQSPNYFAMVPNATFQIGNWSGTGYAIIYNETGAGKYLISGGLNGGSTDRETKEIETTDFIQDVSCQTVNAIYTMVSVIIIQLKEVGKLIKNPNAILTHHITVIREIEKLSEDLNKRIEKCTVD